MLGLLPACARNGCPFPGIVKFEFTEDGQTYTAMVCPRCLLDAGKLFSDVRELRKLDRLERREASGPVVPEA